jgi:hypothetical protein
MSVWAEIVSAALVGTERQASPLPSAESATLDSLFAQLKGETRERALLGAAAAASLHARAGRLPALDRQPLPEPCEADELPRCGARAARHLTLMLGGEYKEVLPEWLGAAAQASKRVPEECLPALLDLGKAREELRDAIMTVAGRRGAWLAAQNAEWHYAVEKFDESHWETGSGEARLAFIKWLRASDPARARELVAKAWDESSPKNRADFIATFYTGLSMQDEPFLEQALDDRSTIVRRAAADVLKWLPESAFVRRMAERVRAYVRFEKRLLRRIEIHVTLPGERTPEMLRDGLTTKPVRPAVGEKAWLLYQMADALPLDFWLLESGCDLAELLRAAKKSEWKEILIDVWSNAALRELNFEAMALIGLRHINYRPVHLLGRVSQEKLQEIARRLLQADPALDSQNPACWFLSMVKDQWGEELSLAVLQSLTLPESETILRGDWLWLADFASRHLNASCIPEAVAVFSSLSSANHRVQARLGQCLKDLEFRQDMLKEINR